MDLLGFLRRRKLPQPTYRLVWFELDIAPREFRFAIIPEQPILIGLALKEGEPAPILLVRYKEAPNRFLRIVEQVDALVRECGVLRLPQSVPPGFSNGSEMADGMVSLRIAYADNTSWASLYESGSIPAAVAQLVEATKSIGRELIQTNLGKPEHRIDGETAKRLVDRSLNTTQQREPTVIVKVRVLLNGKITANGEEVSMKELGAVLDDLKAKGGAVWYHREAPEAEPSESLLPIVDQVIREIAERKLPVKLQREDY